MHMVRDILLRRAFSAKRMDAMVGDFGACTMQRVHSHGSHGVVVADAAIAVKHFSSNRLAYGLWTATADETRDDAADVTSHVSKGMWNSISRHGTINEFQHRELLNMLPSAVRSYQRLFAIAEDGTVYVTDTSRPHKVLALDCIREVLLVERLRRAAEVDLYVVDARVSLLGDEACLSMSSACGSLIDCPPRSPLGVCKLHKKLESAVSFLHRQGIAHRDIKPANVLVFRDQEYKLCDFGAATIVPHDNRRRMTDVLTTFPYAAPEILLGAPYDVVRCDIWSVGVVLVESYAYAQETVALSEGEPWKHRQQLFTGSAEDVICQHAAFRAAKDVWNAGERRDTSDEFAFSRHACRYAFGLLAPLLATDAEDRRWTFVDPVPVGRCRMLLRPPGSTRAESNGVVGHTSKRARDDTPISWMQLMIERERARLIVDEEVVRTFVSNAWAHVLLVSRCCTMTPTTLSCALLSVAFNVFGDGTVHWCEEDFANVCCGDTSARSRFDSKQFYKAQLIVMCVVVNDLVWEVTEEVASVEYGGDVSALPLGKRMRAEDV